jgi:hypothetical protein
MLLCGPSTLNKEITRIDNIINDLDLSDIQKKILKERYTQVIYTLYNRTSKYSHLYHIGHFIITVGSLFVPALLSVQYSDTTGNNTTYSNQQIAIYWATWVISLLVTIFNGVITLYRVDKKYFLLITTLERLRSEGWQYFSLTGRYSGYLINHMLPTHTNQFIYFCYAIEKICLKLVSEEFFKNNDKSDTNILSSNNTYTNSITEQSKNNYSISNEMYVPSPDKKIVASKPVKDVVNSIIKARTNINSLTRITSANKLKNVYTPSNSRAPSQIYSENDDDSIYVDNLSSCTYENDNNSEKEQLEKGPLENEIILIDK